MGKVGRALRERLIGQVGRALRARLIARVGRGGSLQKIFLPTPSSYLKHPIRRGREILRAGIFFNRGGKRSSPLISFPFAFKMSGTLGDRSANGAGNHSLGQRPRKSPAARRRTEGPPHLGMNRAFSPPLENTP